jgi:hypothetical protein
MSSPSLSNNDNEMLVFTDKHNKQYKMTIAQWKKTAVPWSLPDWKADDWFKAVAVSREGNQYDHWVPAYYKGECGGCDSKDNEDCPQWCDFKDEFKNYIKKVEIVGKF